MENMIKDKVSKIQLIVVGIKGDNLSMIYYFKCNCALHSNYKNYYHIMNDCSLHALPILTYHITQIKDWSDIPHF